MKKRWGIILTAIVLVLLIYVLKDIEFVKVAKLINKMNLFYFSLAFLSFFLSILLSNVRFQICVYELIRSDFWFLLKVLFAGNFINAITPGAGTGGEPVRAYFLGEKYKTSKTKFFGTIIADKFFGLVVQVFFTIASLFFIFIYLDIHANLKIIFESFIAIIFIIILVRAILTWKKIKFNSNYFYEKIFKYKFIKKRFKSPFHLKRYITKKIAHFIDSFKCSIVNKKRFAINLFLSLIIWLLIYLSSYFLFLALDVRVNFLSVIVVVAMGYLIGDISPVPGGIGLAESTMFILYSAMGIEPSLAAIVALLSRMIYYFFSIPLGGLSLIYLRATQKP